MRTKLILTFTAAALLGSLFGSPAIAADSPAFTDGFEAFPTGTWSQNTRYGAWQAMHNGYGTFGIAQDGSHVHMQAPKASTDPGETHSSLVRTLQSYGDLDLSVRLRTVRQLRTPTPNEWEVAWLNWHFLNNETFYYIVLKPGGWELGKVDGTRVDPAGPRCYWPTYVNCVYPGAQRFLATGGSPTFPVGPWYTVNVRQVGNQINVTVDGAPLVSFTDEERPYTAGQVSLYNEDAHVEFDDVRIEPLGALPPPPAPAIQTLPSRAVQATKTFGLRWGASVPVNSYDVVVRRASYAWGSFTSEQPFRSATPYTTGSFSGTLGYTYCFRARARNTDGATSLWSKTCTTQPIDERSLARTGKWSAGSNSRAYLGTFLRSIKRGSTLRRNALGIKQIWVVATKCPTCGRVDVYVGRTRVARLNLYASRTVRRQMIRAVTLLSPRSGTVTLRVMSSGRPVIIEGLGLLRIV